MKNQLCFTLKIRSGARTEPYIVCDPLCVNDGEILINGKKVSASTISKSVISFIVGRYVSPIKEKVEAETQPTTGNNTPPPATLEEEITPGVNRKCCAGCEEYGNDENKDCSGDCPA